MRGEIKQITKRFAAWMLVLIMVVTSVPMNTFAEEATNNPEYISNEQVDLLTEAEESTTDISDTTPANDSTNVLPSDVTEAEHPDTEQTDSNTSNTDAANQSEVNANETNNDPSMMDNIEEEVPEIHFTVTYHDEIPSEDWIYQIVYKDENDQKQYYTGTYYIYDQNGQRITSKDGERVEADKEGTITIPLLYELPKDTKTVEKYRINKTDSALKGFTVTLTDAKEARLYNCIQLQSGGLQLDTSDSKAAKEQTVIAQKDSENHPEDNAVINTAHFPYKGADSEIVPEQEDASTESDETNDLTEDTNASEAQAQTHDTFQDPSAEESQEPENTAEEASMLPTTEKINEGTSLLNPSLDNSESNVAKRAAKARTLLQTDITAKVTIELSGDTDALKDKTFKYEIKQTAGAAYTGKYIVLDKDGNEINTLAGSAINGIITISNPAPGYQIVLTEVTDNVSYLITDQTEPTVIETILLDKEKNTSKIVTASTDSAAATFGYREIANDVTLKKQWVDGHAEHDRDTLDGNGFIKLFYKTIEDGNEVEKEATSNNLGIVAGCSLETDSADTFGLTVWTYTYSELPKYDQNGNEIHYYAKESSFTGVDNYITTYDSNHQIVTNTLKLTWNNDDTEQNDYNATITWKDKDDVNSITIPQTRPAQGSNGYLDPSKIELHRYSITTDDETLTDDITAEHIIIANGTTNNDWNVSLKDLPKYDAQGNEYTYYIKQTSNFAKQENGTNFHYNQKIDNVGAYGMKTNGLYSGGTLTDIRTELRGFNFYVEWEDGGNEWYRNCDLYLFRYATADGTDVATASPVQGFDSMYFKEGTLYCGTTVILPNEDGSYTWTGASGTNLDEYAPSGARYTYFIKQKNLGNPDYQSSYYDEDPTTDLFLEKEDPYIFANGKIINQLSTQTSPQITKTWEAKALQGKIGALEVKLQLQRRYVYQQNKDATPTYTAWENVQDQGNDVTTTEGGFSSAVMTRDVGTGSFPGYTDEDLTNQTIGTNGVLPKGTKIEYQWVETAVVYNGTTYLFNETTQQTTLNGLTNDGTDVVVKQEYTTTNGLNTAVKNQLIDRTQVNVSKTWAGDPWPEGAVINVKIRREDGNPVLDNENNAVSCITLSEGNQTDAFKNLPRYDDEGKEIIYYVEEQESTIAGNGKIYSYYDTSYNRTSGPVVIGQDDEGDDITLNIHQTNATIQNTLPGEGSVNINVNKRWLDDGDLTHRKDTKIGIFSTESIIDKTAFNADGTLKEDMAEKIATLSDGGAWTQKLSFTPTRVISYLTITDPEHAKTTEETDYPICNTEGIQEKDNDGHPLYWSTDHVTTSSNPTDYIWYVQKTTTTYNTNHESTTQAENYDGKLLYWTDDTKKVTTTTVTDYPVYPRTSVVGDTKKLVYLDDAGHETTENTGVPKYVKRTTATVNASDYIALEIQVGTAEADKVVYKNSEGSYAWLTDSTTLSDGTDATKHIGEVGTKEGSQLDHLYNVAIGETTANGMSGYVIYNQRKGVQTIDLQKTWKNGNLSENEQPRAAYFKLYRKLNGQSDEAKVDVTGTCGTLRVDTGAIINNLGTIDTIELNNTIEIPNKKSTNTSDTSIMQAVINDLPKYDEKGRLYQYSIEEVAVEDPDPDAPIRLVENGGVKVSVMDSDGSYKYNTTSTNNVEYYDSYSSSVGLDNAQYGNQNTNDVFTYKSENKRSQNFSVILRKVWQDDGTGHESEILVRRPDIYFRMYRVPTNKVEMQIGTDTKNITTEADLLQLKDTQVTELLSKEDVKQVGDDYTWDTKLNDWYWTCDMDGQFERYDSDGNEFLYFAIELSKNFEDYKTVYYNGEQLPNGKYNGTTPVNTEEVFNDENNKGAHLLIVHKEGDGLQSNGSILNVREEKFKPKATKIWANLPPNIKESQTPTIYMELRRRLILNAENKIYGEWETIDVKKSNGSTTFPFAETQRYDSYGRKYEFDVQERFYEAYDKINIATLLTLGADSQFFYCTDEAKSRFDLMGEGYYYKTVGGTYQVASEDQNLPSGTTFYTRKVTYTRDNTGDYVKMGENEYQLFSQLTPAEQNLVRNSQRYSKNLGEYVQLIGTMYVGLDYVPGYKPAEITSGDSFTWKNTYDSSASDRQRVEITVNKTWEIPTYADETAKLEFQLWRKIDGVAKSDEQVTTATNEKTTGGFTETTKGKTKTVSVTFTRDDMGALPYYAPNGKPYQYYVKEIVPGGYLGKVAGADNSVVSVQGDGTDQQELISQVVTFPLQNHRKDGNNIVYFNQASTGTKDAKTSFTNTYNGVPSLINQAIKKWDDENNAYGTRPDDIQLELQQSGGGNTVAKTVAFSYKDTTSTDSKRNTINGTWSANKATTSNWTFDFTNGYINDDTFLAAAKNDDGTPVFTTDGNANVNFPMYGPNGEKYTYTVVESAVPNSTADPDSTKNFACYDQELKTDVGETKITNILTNTLPLTSITAKKIWQGNDGTPIPSNPSDKELETYKADHTWIYNGGTHSDDELKNLYNMGSMPRTITFKLQYTNAVSPAEADWTDVPDATADKDKKFTKVFELSGTDENSNFVWNQFATVTELRNKGVTFEKLPKYIFGDNTKKDGATLRKYRIVETVEYKDGTSGKFTQVANSVTTATNGGTTTVTNEITLKKVTLVKEWQDKENFLDTRPDDIIFVVANANGSETYELSKAENSIEGKKDQWSREIWLPRINGETVTEPFDVQNEATKEKLVETVDETTNRKIYNVAENEPNISSTTDSAGNTVHTVKNVLDTTLTKRTQITVSKTWVDTDYSSMYSLIHPAEIEYTLQYSHKQEDGKWSAWQDADAGCGVNVSSSSSSAGATGDSNDNAPSTIDDMGSGDDSSGTSPATPQAETEKTKKSTYTATPKKGEKNWPDVTWEQLYQYYSDTNTDVALPIRYRVVENTVNGYKTTYTTDTTDLVAKEASAVNGSLYDSKGDIEVTNTIDDSASISLKKDWGNKQALMDALGVTALSSLTEAQVGILQNKGLLPMSLTFRLQYSTNGTTWTDVPQDATNKEYTKTFSAAKDIAALYNGAVTQYAKLPAKDKDGNTLKYQFVETQISFKNSDTTEIRDVSNGHVLYGISYTSTATGSAYQISTTNAIPTAEITVTKSANDENNRDGKRGDVVVKLYRNGETYATATLTYDSTNGTWSSKTWTVPIYAADKPSSDGDFTANEWTVKETSKNDGYADSYVYVYKVGETVQTSDDPKLTFDNTKKVGSVAITNTREPERFAVTATKNWDDLGDTMGNTRPDHVDFTLQYKDGKNWKNVTYAKSVDSLLTSSDTYVYLKNEKRYYKLVNGNYEQDDEGVYTTSTVTQSVKGSSTTVADNATWNDLSLNRKATQQIEYRVVENATSDGGDSVKLVGYDAPKMIISTKEATTFNGTNGATTAVEMKNSLTKTNLELIKTWDGDTDYATQIRPQKVTYQIEYSGDGGTNWALLPDGVAKIGDTAIKDGTFTVDVSDATKTTTLSGLPLQKSDNGNDSKKYLYRVTETAITYTTGTVGANQIVTANLAKTDSKVTWADLANNTDSNFVTTNETNTIGAYTISNGETKWDTSVSKWKTSIKNTLDTVTLETTKEWVDENNRDGKRMNVAFSATAQKKSGADWSGLESTDVNYVSVSNSPQTLTWNSTTQNSKVEWTNLPKYLKTATDHSDSNLYNYKITETTNATGNGYSAPTYTQATAGGSTLSATVTNTRTVETMTIKAKKIWSGDDNNSMGTRPASIYVTLQYKDVTDTTATDTNKWKNVPATKDTTTAWTPYLSANSGTLTQELKPGTDGKWSGEATWIVPSYGNTTTSNNNTSQKIQYRVVESDSSGNPISINGYTKTDSIEVNQSTSDKTSNVTNTLDTTTLTLTKSWAGDSTYYSQVRPDAINYKLEYSKNGTDWTPVPLSIMKSENISTTKGNTITTGGTDSATAGAFKVSVNKAAVANTDEVTFKNLPLKDSAGTAYQYKVTEESIVYGSTTVSVNRTGTDATVGSYKITAEATTSGTKDSKTVWTSGITNTLETTEFEATKAWSDQSNRDGLRKEVTFNLFRDGGTTAFDSTKKAGTGITTSNGVTTVVNETGVKWTGLPKYKVNATAHNDDNLSMYTVTETNPYTDGAYTASPASIPTNDGSKTITNTHTIADFEIKATKSWDDDNNAMGSRPESVTVQLQYATADGAAITDALDSANWTALTSTTAQTNGKDAYLISGEASQSISSTNTTATWKVPAHWFDTATGTSKDLKYRIIETSVNGYTRVQGAVITNQSTSKTEEITNQLNRTTLAFTKNWAGEGDYQSQVRPDKVTYKIEYCKNGTGALTWNTLPNSVAKIGDNYISNGEFTVKSNKNGTADTETITNLPVKDSAGTAYRYRISEVKLHYGTTEVLVKNPTNPWTTATDATLKSTWSGATAGTYAVTGETKFGSSNVWSATLTNTMQTVNLEAEKIWDDDNNRDGKRQDLTFSVATQTGLATVNQLTIPSKDLTWNDSKQASKVSWSGLPKYLVTASEHNTDNLYQYTITETPSSANDYSCTYVQATSNTDSTNLSATATNKRDVQTFTISAKKNWAGDDNNSMGTRPDSIYVTLQYLDQDGTWKNVPTATAQGNVAGWTPYLGNATKELNSNNTWSTTWTVPAYGNKNTAANTVEEIQYRVIETTSAGVAAFVDGYTKTEKGAIKYSSTDKAGDVTNTLNTTSLTLTKSWAGDNTYRSQVRPSKVNYKMEYSTDGTNWTAVPQNKLVTTNTTVSKGTNAGEFSVTVTQDEKGQDQVEFTGLPIEKSDKTPYQYRVTELSIVYGEGKAAVTVPVIRPEGTAATVGTYKITNEETKKETVDKKEVWKSNITNTLETITFTAKKAWADETNRDGYRTQEVTFNLFRDGGTTAFDPNKKAGTGITTTEVTGQDGTKTTIVNETTVTWTDLPKYKVDASGRTDADLSVYTVKETNPYIEGQYAASPDELNTNGGTITNTHTVDSFTITASKKWTDYENAMDSRTANGAATFTLQYATAADAAAGDAADSSKWTNVKAEQQTNGIDAYVIAGTVEQTVTKDDSTASWTVPKHWYDVTANASKDLKYRILETTIDGYTRVKTEVFTQASTSKEEKIENKLKTKDLAFTKNWADEGDYQSTVRPDSVTYKIEYCKNGTGTLDWKVLPDGVAKAGTAAIEKGVFTLTSDKTKTEDTVNITGLPVKDSAGVEYRYRISEVSLKYGMATVNVDTSNASWTDASASLKSTWSGAIADTYAVTGSTEQKASAWTATLTNTMETFDLETTKIWEDKSLLTAADAIAQDDANVVNPVKAENCNYTRPTDVTLTLQYYDGSKWTTPNWLTDSEISHTVDATNNWKTTWAKLPIKFVNASGVQTVAKYRVVETNATGDSNKYLFAKETAEISGVNQDGTVTAKVSEEVTNKPIYLKLHKTDGSNTDLEGVTFDVEMKNSDNTYTKVVTGAATNADGLVTIIGLEAGDYRVTETSTVAGQQLLSESFNVTLPLSLSKGSAELATVENKEGGTEDNNGNWNFYQLTYTVTNTANFDIPITGSFGLWYPGFLAFLPIMAVYFGYRRRKKQQSLIAL